MADKIKINLVGDNIINSSIWTYAGKSLWEALAGNGIDTGGSCGGQGICGKCRVKIEGDIASPEDDEKRHLLAEELRAGERLACYVKVHNPLNVHLPGQNNALFSYSNKGFIEKERTAGPVSKKKTYIPGIDRNNPVPIQQRLATALPGYRLDISVKNYNELYRLDRERPAIELNTLIFDENRVKYAGRQEKTAYGIALDLGSTSIFAALIDLVKGNVVSVASGANMLKVYGADIISRVKYCMDHEDGLTVIHQVLINNINQITEKLLGDAEASKDSIYKFAVVGNPVMLHFFMGLNPGGFSAAPYAGIIDDEICYRAANLSLLANEGAELYILPQVGGFVGADALACLLSLGVANDRNFLLVDIGTNAEIILSKGSEMWAASAAAGPAFEGGNITNGTGVVSGAIDRVYLNDDGTLGYGVLGNGPVKGICGSGIIDAVACLLKAGYIDSNGTFTEKARHYLKLYETQKGRQLNIVEGKQSHKGLPIVFNQEDIRQVQLAKAAIQTAIQILMQEAGLTGGNLNNIYLAGAFGNYINPDNGILIGLLPEMKTKKFKNIGNAAGRGAILALLDRDIKDKASRLKAKIHHIELASHPGFQDRFINNIALRKG